MGGRLSHGYGIAVLAILLAPISFGSIVHPIWQTFRSSTDLLIGSSWVEFTANILLFVPVGIILSMLLHPPWVGVILSMAVSISVELLQALVPYRQPSVRDVLANVIGACIGAFLVWLVVVSSGLGVTKSK